MYVHELWIITKDGIDTRITERTWELPPPEVSRSVGRGNATWAGDHVEMGTSFEIPCNGSHSFRISIEEKDFEVLAKGMFKINKKAALAAFSEAIKEMADGLP